MADNRQMLDKWKDFRLSRYQQLGEEKIKMGFAWFDNYFKFIERDIKKVGDSIKRLIKDLAKDTKDGEADYKKQVLELQNFYKKYVIEMDVKFKQFKRKNTWLS